LTTSGAGSAEYHEPSERIGLPFEVNEMGLDPVTWARVVALSASADQRIRITGLQEVAMGIIRIEVFRRRTGEGPARSLRMLIVF
jgi:hypothetical protein